MEVIVAFVDDHRDELGVEPICRALQIAPSSYYAVKKREINPSARAVRDSAMMHVLMVVTSPVGCVWNAPARRSWADPRPVNGH